MTLGRVNEQGDFIKFCHGEGAFYSGVNSRRPVGDAMPGLQTLEELAALFSCKPFKPRSWVFVTSRLPSLLRLCFL